VTLPATTVGSLPTDPARTGYSFGGWWTQAGGGGSQFLADSTVSASLSVYAKWTGNSYTVTLDGQGMTPSPSSITVTYGSTYASLPTPSNGSYTFGGWWTGTSGSGSQVTTASTVSITASQTLYALWTLVEARIYPSTTSANMQNGSWAPANATDGDANTYWSTSASANYGTAALYANLSSVKYVTKVMIHWEAGPQTWNLLSVASGGSQGNGAWLTIPVNQNWQNFELDIAGSNGSNGASVYDFQVWGY